MIVVDSNIDISPISLRPQRLQRLRSSKLIFIACEGEITEEQYFDEVLSIYSDISEKIKIFSARKATSLDKHSTDYLSGEKNSTCNTPLQLIKLLEDCTSNRDISIYDHDEFWIVFDVDQNFGAEKTFEGVKYDNLLKAIDKCNKKNYNYAISNPFFEVWLLLHFDDASDSDISFAVTKDHCYEKTKHFVHRLSNVGYPLKGKSIPPNLLSRKNIQDAIRRASDLFNTGESNNNIPYSYGSTVYRILQSFEELC